MKIRITETFEIPLKDIVSGETLLVSKNEIKQHIRSEFELWYNWFLDEPLNVNFFPRMIREDSILHWKNVLRDAGKIK